MNVVTSSWSHLNVIYEANNCSVSFIVDALFLRLQYTMASPTSFSHIYIYSIDSRIQTHNIANHGLALATVAPFNPKVKKLAYEEWAVAIAPWFRLSLPSCGPGFESQGHHLRFFQFVLLNL